MTAAGSLLYKGQGASNKGGVRMPEPLPTSPATASALAARILHAPGGPGIEAIVQVGSKFSSVARNGSVRVVFCSVTVLGFLVTVLLHG